jgi:hypothetical protein
VVINNLDVFRTAGGPDKTHAPLIIDTNAVLTLSVILQCFKSIAWW